MDLRKQEHRITNGERPQPFHCFPLRIHSLSSYLCMCVCCCDCDSPRTTGRIGYLLHFPGLRLLSAASASGSICPSSITSDQGGKLVSCTLFALARRRGRRWSLRLASLPSPALPHCETSRSITGRNTIQNKNNNNNNKNDNSTQGMKANVVTTIGPRAKRVRVVILRSGPR